MSFFVTCEVQRIGNYLEGIVLILPMAIVRFGGLISTQTETTRGLVRE